jgi:hypothetical protein
LYGPEGHAYAVRLGIDRAKNVQQHSGGWMMTGKVPVARAGSTELPATIGRMDAIQNTGPWQDRRTLVSRISRTASCRLAHGLCVFGAVLS